MTGTAGTQKWFGGDQPCFVADPTDGNYFKCIGYKEVPASSDCTNYYFAVDRLCACDVGGKFPSFSVSLPLLKGNFPSFPVSLPLLEGNSTDYHCLSTYVRYHMELIPVSTSFSD